MLPKNIWIAKAFPRWMMGTCIEIDTSGAPDFDSQTFTHYDDIEKNVLMKSISDLFLNDILKIEKTVSISPEEQGYAKSANIQDLYILSKTKEIRVTATKNQVRDEIADEVKEFLFLLLKERQRLLKERPASIVRLTKAPITAKNFGNLKK